METFPALLHSKSVGIYIHIPFCAKKCGYCDFNAYSGYSDGTKARYVDALCREIAARSEPKTHVPTVFFGGGTPTNLPAEDLVRILSVVRENFAVDTNAEVSVEANPTDATPAYLETLREAGFNRLSFGVQTFNDRLLTLIDRIHSGDEARRAVATAKTAGFDNISLDLMFALPRQTLADWNRTLDSALALNVPHLSIYSLIIEEGTPFYARRERGKLSFPSESLEATMFGEAIRRVTGAGYEHYEVSNYAKPGFRSRHNALYWHNAEYFGFGAGAVSYINGTRATNERRPTAYIERVGREGSVYAETETLTRKETRGETIMLALRMRDGLDLEAFAARFGTRAEVLYEQTIARHVAGGLLEQTPTHLRLTERGLFLANEVMADFL